MRTDHYEELKHIFCKGENVSYTSLFFGTLKFYIFSFLKSNFVFQCDYWHKKARDLQSHFLRQHSKEKNFLCDKCDHRVSFQFLFDLKRLEMKRILLL